MFSPELLQKATELVALYKEKRLTIATAESCTGGLVSGLITAVPGASSVLDRGFITYSNVAKEDTLGVHPLMIMSFGAVSAQTARAMAGGALAAANTDVSISVTGIAGPDGGSEYKPVGLVHFCCASAEGKSLERRETYGDIGRNEVRLAAVATAIELLFEIVS